MTPYFSDKITARFFSKVAIGLPDECWPWLGCKTTDGYGLFNVMRRNRCAHRYVKEIELGERIERSLDASHVCENRACVNPKHIIMETRRENMRRSTHVYFRNGLGVSWSKWHRKWRAYYYTRTEGRAKTNHVGYFATPEAAASAVKLAREAAFS